MKITTLKEAEIAAISGGLSFKNKVILGVGTAGAFTIMSLIRHYSGSIIIGTCAFLGGAMGISNLYRDTKNPIANTRVVITATIGATFIGAIIGAYLDKKSYRDPITLLLQK